MPSALVDFFVGAWYNRNTIQTPKGMTFMKKRTILSILISILLIFALLSCSGGERLATFEKGSARSHVIPVGEYWYCVIGEYGKSEKQISVSRAIDETNVIHTAKGGELSSFVASDGGCAWTEKNDEGYFYYCYSAKNGKVTKLRTSADSDPQIQNIGINGECVYYAYIDYTDESAAIYSYDMSSGNTAELCPLAYEAEATIDCLSVGGGYLSAVMLKGDVSVLISVDLGRGKKDEIELPAEVSRVFDVAFDSSTQKWALYFSDENQEKIGVLDGGKVVTLAAFSPIQFAYRDEIDFYDGKVYWVRETTDTAPSEAKYVLVAYDYASGDSKEYENAFFFNVDANGLLALKYDGKESFEKVELFNY